MRKLKSILLLAALALPPASSPGITILSGPVLRPATNAPLAGALELTTDVDSRVSVSVDDGVRTWTRDFYDYGQAHSLALAGFKPGRTNLITVTVLDKERNQATPDAPLSFITRPLPSSFPHLNLLTSQPDRIEPGYTVFRVALNYSKIVYLVVVDSAGEVVWYSPIPALLEIRQLPNGDFFTYSYTNFMELNLLGETVRSWTVPTNLVLNAHEGFLTPHGTILFLADAKRLVDNYPTSTATPNPALGTANIQYQQVVELSATNGDVLNIWSPVDLLDPRRITYMTTLSPQWDSEHSNAITEDPSDDSIIVSMRHQNAVIKFSRATGQLVWILGPPALWGAAWQPYLLAPTGIPFAWQYAQHAPALTAQGTLLVYDDGNKRASPYDPPVADTQNFSRAVEYRIDSQAMTVSQVWDYGSNIPERLYTDKVGSAEQLPQTGNVLVTFGSVDYINGKAPSARGSMATIARIKEVTHDAVPEVLWDLQISDYQDSNNTLGDCFAYRSHRIPDLYAHPALAVGDLTVSHPEGAPLVEFTADPARTYTVEVSSDLRQWQELGTPVFDEEAGQFVLQDPDADGTTARFYRVVTH